jgi:WD40 repeat protein/tRNA A-37 threonylcarbamoyl transferase component Bud32
VSLPGYEILGELGRGGMGVVYKARQTRLNRLVALKMILAGRHAGEADLARFRTEAEAIARLQHPHIVQVYEVGEYDGIPYFSLEFCGGGSLERRLDGTPLPPPEAAALLESLALAAHAAHQHDIVHRDLKPANILLSDEGEPKLTDFGLAKRLDAQGQTQSGAVMGTPSYMAPEQADGKSKGLGPAADVYALGAILYECLTGRPPFKAATPLDTLMQVIHDEPVPPSRLQPTVPRDLETICLRCLQKDPAKRFPTALALAEDLDRFRTGEPVASRPVGALERGWRWCRRNPRLAALTASVALLLVLIAVGALVAAVWLNQERQVARAQEEQANTERLAAEQNLRRAVDAENDAREKLWGSYLAQARAGRFSRQPGQRFDSLEALARAAAIRPTEELRDEAIACLALADLRRAGPREGPAEPETPLWFCKIEPDDRGRVNITDKRSGRRLVSLPGHTGANPLPVWSPDGRYLAVFHPGVDVGPRALTLWDWRNEKVLLRGECFHDTAQGWIDGSRGYFFTGRDGVTRLYELPGGKVLREVRLEHHPTMWFHPSPDGRLVAATSRTDRVVELFDFQSGRLLARLDVPGTMAGVAWHPHSRLLACRCSRAGIVLWDVRERKKLATSNAGAEAGLWFSRDGDLLLASGWDGLIHLIDPVDGSVLLSAPGALGWGPLADDRWVAELTTYMGYYELATGHENWLLDRHRRDFGVHADFTPDGRLLALAGPDAVALYDVEARAEVARLPVGYSESVLFHPSGRGLVTYTATRGLEWWPVKRPTDGSTAWQIGPPRSLGQHPQYAQYNWMAWGAGDQLVVSDWKAGTVVLLDSSRPTARRVFPHHGPRSVSASPDGRWVAAGTWTGKALRVWDAATGLPVKDLEVPNPTSGHVAFSPDGKWLVTASSDAFRWWRTGTWEAGRVLERGGTWLPGPLAFSPDGKLLAVCDKPDRVKLLDAQNGAMLANLPGRGPKGIVGLRFNRDGTRLLVSQEGTYLWDLAAVRTRLAAMGLQGDWQPFAVERCPRAASPLEVSVDFGIPHLAGPPAPRVVALPERPAQRPTASGEQIAAWINQFGRDAEAERRLVEIGPTALPALEAAWNAAEGERRKQLQVVRDRIEVAEALTPRRVHLKFEDAPLAEAVAALAEQTRLPLVYKGPVDRRFRLTIDGAAAPEALDLFAREAGLRLTMANGQLAFTPGPAAEPGLTASGGPLRVQALSWSFSGFLTLGGAEPTREYLGLTLAILNTSGDVMQAASPRARTARGEGGQSFLPRGPLPGLLDAYQPLSLSTQRQVFLDPAARGRGKLSELEVVVPVEVAVRRRDLATVALEEKPAAKIVPVVGGGTLTVRSASRQREHFQVSVILSTWAGVLPENAAPLFKLIDDQGREYGTLQSSISRIPLARRVFWPADLALLSAGAGPPFAALALAGRKETDVAGVGGFLSFLVGDAPTDTRFRLVVSSADRVRTEIPVRFRNVPLP